MYNARLFYNNSTGAIIRAQTLTGGQPLSIEDEILLLIQDGFVDADVISYFEWDDPENELEAIISEGKLVKVDISTTPHAIYGVEPEVVEPSEDDEISGNEFLTMVEGVM